jgi:hypothetical protein
MECSLHKFANDEKLSERELFNIARAIRAGVCTAGDVISGRFNHMDLNSVIDIFSRPDEPKNNVKIQRILSKVLKTPDYTRLTVKQSIEVIVERQYTCKWVRLGSRSHIYEK